MTRATGATAGHRSALGRSWLVIASRRHQDRRIRKRVFLGLLLMALDAVHRPRHRALARRRTCRRRRRCSRRRAETFRDFLDKQGFFVFVVTDLRRRRPDRQRSPRQRPADLPVEAAAAHRVHRRQGGDPVHVPDDGHLGAGDPAAVRAGDVRRQLRVPEGEPVPVPGDHRRLAAAGPARDLHHAGAVVAVEEQPLRRHALCRHPLLLGGDLRRDVRHHRRQHELLVSLARRESDAGDATSSSGCRRATRRRGRSR